MNEEDLLRAALHRAVPDAPEPTGWVGSARRQARRGRVTAGIVALVVALVAVPVAWSGLRGSTVALPSAPSASPVAAPTVAPAEPVSPICLQHREPSTLAAAGLPLGAQQATVCAEGTESLSYAGIADALTIGVDELIRSFNGLPVGAANDCETAPGLRFRIVFNYPDGSARVIRGENGCDVIGAPRQWRSPGSDVITSFRALLMAQRSQSTLPGLSTFCGHFTHRPLLSFDLGQVVAGAMCLRDPRGQGDLGGMIALSPTELELLRADITANSSVARNDDSRLNGPQLTLIGPWGDPLVFWRVEGDQWFSFIEDGHDQLFWTPSAEAESLVESLLSRLTPTATADYCAGLTPSPAGTALPEAPERMRLCPWGADGLRLNTPLDALESPGADAVLDQFRKLSASPPNGPCNADLGPEFLLVLEPARGEPVVMQLQLYGCRRVGVPGAHRSGADAVLASFRSELTRQRAITQPLAGQLRPGSWCGTSTHAAPSVMPANVDDTVAGRACHYDGKATDAGPSLERTLTEAEVELIRADLQALATSTARCSPKEGPSRRIALATPWLDLILLDQDCGGYTFPANGKSMTWRPSAKASALLERVLA